MSAADWPAIGTVVGETSTAEFTFVLQSYKSRVGDIVAVPMQVPSDDYSQRLDIIAWGRVTSIERYNPFFPYEAAQELTEQNMRLVDTVLSATRDQLEATVTVLGFTGVRGDQDLDLYPLTYPIPPAAQVCYPPADAIRRLLSGGLRGQTPLRIGTLIARTDVEVAVSAEKIASRHLAIMAMTGGGKTVAARRILRELIEIGYPVVILDPHGDYLGLWEKKDRFPYTRVRLFYPHIVMTTENRRIVETLIAKMTVGLTEAQQELMTWLLSEIDPRDGEAILEYIDRLVTVVTGLQNRNEVEARGAPKVQVPTARAVRRSLSLVRERLQRMDTSNRRLRTILSDLDFEALPDPQGAPEEIVRPWQVSILYLGGYDHLTQSTIVSILLEALFSHRAELTDKIPPFLAVIEEAHNFVPSLREGTEETPSLATVRKVITEGRKFGVGLILITQRPSRVDETVLAQCNSFLVMRLVNPRDQQYVRTVMENLPESDARMLSAFGPGQGIISGQAVRFPLLVKISYDEDLVSARTGDENFIQRARDWHETSGFRSRARAAEASKRLRQLPSRRKRVQTGRDPAE
jgi:DNA helicase HerA-like ATPase